MSVWERLFTWLFGAAMIVIMCALAIAAVRVAIEP